MLAFKNEKIWRYISDIWTVLFMLFVIFNFFQRNYYNYLVAPLSVIYISVLSLYISTKEFDRWYENHDSRHPGELFLIAWTVIIFLLTLFSIWLGKSYEVSSEVVAVYIMALSAFALTQKSKQMHARHRSK